MAYFNPNRHRQGVGLAEARLLQRGPRRGVRLAAGEWETPGAVGTVGTVGGSPPAWRCPKEIWGMRFSPSKIGDFQWEK